MEKIIILAIIGLLVGFWTAGYLIGRKRAKVTGIGRDTYIRFYPNPGIGIVLNPNKRVALSVVGGFEVFEKSSHGYWVRKKAYFTRIPHRPGLGG